MIEYRPLQPTSEFSTTFEAVSPNLGTFPYSFILSAPTAEPEPLITIKCHLGQQNVHNAYVFNWSKTNAEVTATVRLINNFLFIIFIKFIVSVG